MAHPCDAAAQGPGMAQAPLLARLPQLNQRRIVLASASPRRSDLLKQIGLTFQVWGLGEGAGRRGVVPRSARRGVATAAWSAVPLGRAGAAHGATRIARRFPALAQVVESRFVEDLPKDRGGRAYALATAVGKARAVARQLGAGACDLVIAADTVVELGEEVLEKPGDAAHAREMLAALSGRRHEVHTGVALVLPGGQEHSFVETTAVHFGGLGLEDIDAYIATGGKAGLGYPAGWSGVRKWGPRPCVWRGNVLAAGWDLSLGGEEEK